MTVNYPRGTLEEPAAVEWPGISCRWGDDKPKIPLKLPLPPFACTSGDPVLELREPPSGTE